MPTYASPQSNTHQADFFAQRTYELMMKLGIGLSY